MRTSKMLLPVIGLSVFGSLALVAWAAQDTEEQVTLDQVPAVVKETILKEAAGAKITEIEREKEGGVLIYEAEWIVDGVEHEIAVAADGALLETEETIPVEKAPAAVRAAIAKHFGDAKVVVEKTMIVVYEVEAEIDGKEKELLIFPTGRVHEDCDHDHDEDHDDDHDHEHDHDHDHEHEHEHEDDD